MRHEADAEQAKQTGGMIALYPSASDVRKLVVAGGEPAADIHLTMGYFGEDVSELSSYSAQLGLDEIALWLPKIRCRAFAHATFNPDAPEGREPCAVYLIGDSHELAKLHVDIQEKIMVNYPSESHAPWIPHITAGYGLEAQDLSFVGEIVLDRIAIEWAGETYDHLL